jgi:hypothetical protein
MPSQRMWKTLQRRYRSPSTARFTALDSSRSVIDSIFALLCVIFSPSSQPLVVN